MRKYLRLVAGLSCLGVLILGAVALDPAAPLLSSFHGCAAQRAALLEELKRKNEHLDQLEDALRLRRQAKEQIAEEVIAGRRSLAEAIEQFRELDRPWIPDSILQDILKANGISMEELYGPVVIVYVRQVLADRPDEAAAVVGRLQKELQELLADRTKHRPAPAEPRTEQGR